MTDLDGAPYGGSRYPVDAMMAQRTFAKFHMDVGVGDVVLDPLERIKTGDWLGFAEIAPASVPMIQREQQFAEKLHAYTSPRSGANSRVRDPVDMVLLIQSRHSGAFLKDATRTIVSLCWNLHLPDGKSPFSGLPRCVGSTLR